MPQLHQRLRLCVWITEIACQPPALLRIRQRLCWGGGMQRVDRQRAIGLDARLCSDDMLKQLLGLSEPGARTGLVAQEAVQPPEVGQCTTVLLALAELAKPRQRP